MNSIKDLLPGKSSDCGVTATETGNTAALAMIAAPGSRQGKTVVTAALARQQLRLGKKVCVLKVGPDFLDPMIHQIASGQTVRNLDWWMMGEPACRKLLADAARDNDVVLIESLMGLHDNTPSNAWLASILGLPVIQVMDLSKFAQTAAAIVYGMQTYAEPFELHAVVGNRLGSDHHHNLVREAMPANVHYAGSIRRDDRMILPQRHLGLVQGGELDDLDDRLDAMADCIDSYLQNFQLPVRKIEYQGLGQKVEPVLAGKRIAIANDDAFGFIYQDNIDTLCQLGAELNYFSPLADQEAPQSDALWLPGGYPELHLSRLGKCKRSLESIRQFVESGKPGLAECGGMMLLGNRLVNADGIEISGAGVIDAEFVMQRRFQSVGHQFLCIGGFTIRGHSFHHSSMKASVAPIARWTKRSGDEGESVFRTKNTLMSYGHLSFVSSPNFIADLFLAGANLFANRQENYRIP